MELQTFFFLQVLDDVDNQFSEYLIPLNSFLLSFYNYTVSLYFFTPTQYYQYFKRHTNEKKLYSNYDLVINNDEKGKNI